jgi:nitrite reductase (NADH) small subunit
VADLYVGRTEEFGERDRKIIAQGDLEIGVFHVEGEFYAYENNCVHQGGPACQGKIINRVEEVIHETDKTAHGLKFSETDVHIVCPWHGYEYNVRTGRHPGQKNIRLKPFKVEVKNGEVYVVV